jgi:hypothetical protein
VRKAARMAQTRASGFGYEGRKGATGSAMSEEKRRPRLQQAAASTGDGHHPPASGPALR